ncbi:hypothetical protein [Nostoc sp.]|uniref:hypothetical protein n=1 Tax=Nostoc sp. TaxID=1180 RepID=UPI003FA59341
MVSQIQPPTQPEVIYPDSDGQPVADNTIQFGWIIEPIWDLYLRQPFEHQSDEANIDLSCGIVQGSLKVLDQAFTTGSIQRRADAAVAT